MDAAYDGTEIHRTAEARALRVTGPIPPAIAGHVDPSKERFKQRASVERVNRALKDTYGGRPVRVQRVQGRGEGRRPSVLRHPGPHRRSAPPPRHRTLHPSLLVRSRRYGSAASVRAVFSVSRDRTVLFATSVGKIGQGPERVSNHPMLSLQELCYACSSPVIFASGSIMYFSA